jgi:glycine cleavage system H protein
MAELKFSKTHEWVRIEGAFAFIGISCHAQKELGDIVFVELPRVGEKVKKDGRFGTVESTKAASELYSPLSGDVVSANSELGKSPQLVNESPADKGWMIKIKVENSAEAKELMDQAAYDAFVASEKH